MKKITLFIFALLLITAFASDAVMIMRTRDGGGGCDDCSGDLKFSWHMENVDVTLGTPCGCSDGDEGASTDGTPSLSSTEKSDGTYSAYGDTVDYYKFVISHPDLVDVSEGKVVMDIFIPTGEWAADVTFFDAYYDSGTRINCMTAGSSGSDIEVRCAHDDGWQELEATSGTGHTENEWLRVTVRWDASQSSADFDVELCDLTLPDTTSNCVNSGADNDIDGDWGANTPTELRIGPSGNCAIYVDNIQIYGESGM